MAKSVLPGYFCVVQFTRTNKLTAMDSIQRSIYKSMSMEKLIDFLRNQHHPATREKLVVLNHRLQLLLRANIYSQTDLLRVYHLLNHFKDNFEHHLHKEETLLFPFLEETVRKNSSGKCQGQLQEELFAGPLRLFRHEHQTLTLQMSQLRAVCRELKTSVKGNMAIGRLIKKIELLEEDLQDHIDLENNLLYPSLLQLGHEIKARAKKARQAEMLVH
jgi:regulator of cell morphogenesis and NO signaling